MEQKWLKYVLVKYQAYKNRGTKSGSIILALFNCKPLKLQWQMSLVIQPHYNKYLYTYDRQLHFFYLRW